MNPILTRRRLLATTALVPLGAALAACAGQSPPQAFVTAAGYLQQIVSAVVGEVPVIAKALGLSTTSGTLANVLAYAQQLATAAGVIAGSTVATTAQTALQTAEGIVQSIVAVLGSLNLTGTAGSIVSAIQVVLPVIEALVNGLVGARLTGPDINQALDVLNQAAAGAA